MTIWDIRKWATPVDTLKPGYTQSDLAYQASLTEKNFKSRLESELGGPKSPQDALLSHNLGQKVRFGPSSYLMERLRVLSRGFEAYLTSLNTKVANYQHIHNEATMRDLDVQMQQIESEIEQHAASEAHLITSSFCLDSARLVTIIADQKNSSVAQTILMYRWHDIGIRPPSNLSSTRLPQEEHFQGNLTLGSKVTAPRATLSPCGTFVLTTSAGGLCLFDAESSQLLQELGITDPVAHLLWEGSFLSQASVITQQNRLLTLGWQPY